MRLVYFVHFHTSEIVIFLLFPVLFFCFFKLYMKSMERYEASGFRVYGNKKLVKILVPIFLVFMECVFLLAIYHKYNTIYLRYLNGDYHTVQGIISGFDESDGNEFQVNDIKFKWYKKDGLSLGYNCGDYYFKENERGYITGNGQKIRVDYIKADQTRNIIVAMWVE